MERLEYRSINFVVERYKNMNFYQPGSVFNFPGLEVPYTRIVEYKHFLN
jgi:UDP-galactopyranose mutase